MERLNQRTERTTEMSAIPNDDEKLREEVRERYGRNALQVLQGIEADASAVECCGTSSSCCGTSTSNCCGTGNGDAITGDLYSNAELSELPVAAALASLGC